MVSTYEKQATRIQQKYSEQELREFYRFRKDPDEIRRISGKNWSDTYAKQIGYLSGKVITKDDYFEWVDKVCEQTNPNFLTDEISVRVQGLYYNSYANLNYEVDEEIIAEMDNNNDNLSNTADGYLESLEFAINTLSEVFSEIDNEIKRISNEYNNLHNINAKVISEQQGVRQGYILMYIETDGMVNEMQSRIAGVPNAYSTLFTNDDIEGWSLDFHSMATELLYRVSQSHMISFSRIELSFYKSYVY